VLTSALGWLELARETASPEAHARAFGVIGRSLLRARALVAAIADPDERLRVAVRPFDAGTVLGEVGLNGSRPVTFSGVFRLPMGTAAAAFYLGANGWTPVLPNEQALGYPTVKFEISF